MVLTLKSVKGNFVSVWEQNRRDSASEAGGRGAAVDCLSLLHCCKETSGLWWNPPEHIPQRFLMDLRSSICSLSVLPLLIQTWFTWFVAAESVSFIFWWWRRLINNKCATSYFCWISLDMCHFSSSKSSCSLVWTWWWTSFHPHSPKKTLNSKSGTIVLSETKTYIVS